MKNNLTYFSFAILIIAGIGFTSVWKKNSSNVTIQKTLDFQVEKEAISTTNKSIENLPKSLENQNDDAIMNEAITYKDEHPVLTYLSGFSEAFTKARQLNFENFWFNGDLYHTKLKEDLDTTKESHISSDIPDKQTTVSQNP